MALPEGLQTDIIVFLCLAGVLAVAFVVHLLRPQHRVVTAAYWSGIWVMGWLGASLLLRLPGIV